MAKVSLRIYNREIESLIDQGHIDEAIAHCQHILKTFSKHLATYRLLGKAYLELKRYGDAVDIFGRVLMSVPGDFVSHVGMSIIRDEENKLDDAIWHMQRAFESQPSNAAIQGELQELYGRRDGMEPPKIRMTRGALAYMYVQGELYPQAIAEIRAVLAEEPDRTDMQVLLARAYFLGGQKADASDMCAQLLKRYQYCFDANRIMVDLLPATVGVAESTQVYRMRVGELDPYASFAKGSTFQSNEVADAAINLEKLEYTGQEVPAEQPWGSSLGSGASSAPALAATSTASEPDWLRTGGFSDPFASTQTLAPGSKNAAQSGNEIPDFLRDAGWGESNTPEQPTSFFDEEPSNGDLTPADIPDWLKGQVPTSTTEPVAPQPDPAQSIETPDWLLDKSQTSASEPIQAGTIPDWLSGLDTSKSSTPEPIQAGNIPDWLGGSDTPKSSESEPAQKNSVPDWLGGSDTPQPSAFEPAQESNVPDWLSGLDTPKSSEIEPAQEGTLPDWLSGLDTPKLSASEPAKEGNLPDWLSDMDSQNHKPAEPAPSIENLGSTSEEQDDAVAWLESLAAKHGAKPEELVTDPSKRNEKPPEWVSQAQNINQQIPAPKPPEASVEKLGSTAQEQDDAMAWLESLAAKHGAKPEELVTDPNKRNEVPPEWVSQAQSIGEAASAAVEAEKPDIQDEKVENTQNIGEQFFTEFESAPTTAPALDETSVWLRKLDEEEKQAQSASDNKDLPDWLQDAQSEPEQLEEQNLHRGEIPEWLSGTQQPQDSASQFESAEQESDVQKSDLPNWLSDIEKDVTPQDTYITQNVAQDDLANWLSGLDDEPGLPFDSIPSPDSILFASKSPESATSPQEPEPVAPKSELPDWLSGVDSQNAEPMDEWKNSVQDEPAVPALNETEMPVPVSQAETLPDWLQDVDKEATTITDDDDDTPPWLHREKWEAQAEEPQAPTPTSPSDWHPIEPTQPETATEQKQETPVEVRMPFVPQDVPPPQPMPATQQAVPVQAFEEPAKKKKPGLSARSKPQLDGPSVIAALNQAKGELDRGDIPAALSHYGKLIKKGKHLEETIRDLTESIYRYPVEVGIWQTLGDAYMRANRLKEALEAYNKAEELIR